MSVRGTRKTGLDCGQRLTPRCQAEINRDLKQPRTLAEQYIWKSLFKLKIQAFNIPSRWTLVGRAWSIDTMKNNNMTRFCALKWIWAHGVLSGNYLTAFDHRCRCFAIFNLCTSCCVILCLLNTSTIIYTGIYWHMIIIIITSIIKTISCGMWMRSSCSQPLASLICAHGYSVLLCYYILSYTYSKTCVKRPLKRTQQRSLWQMVA